MSNPVEGSDYTVIMTTEEDLTGATVTIEYRKPGNVVVEDVTPSNVDTTENKISYKLEDTITTQGVWKIWAKIINSSGDVSYVNPAVTVEFDQKGK